MNPLRSSFLNLRNYQACRRPNRFFGENGVCDYLSMNYGRFGVATDVVCGRYSLAWDVPPLLLTRLDLLAVHPSPPTRHLLPKISEFSAPGGSLSVQYRSQSEKALVCQRCRCWWLHTRHDLHRLHGHRAFVRCCCFFLLNCKDPTKGAQLSRKASIRSDPRQGGKAQQRGE